MEKQLKYILFLRAEDDYSLQGFFKAATRTLEDQMMQQPMPISFSDKAQMGVIKDGCSECQRFAYRDPASKRYRVIYNCVTAIDITDPEKAEWVKNKLVQK
jgi:hypothetical protein